MELKLKKVTASELDGGAHMLLGLIHKPFFFLLYDGEVFMRKGMKGASKTTAAIREMWKYDSLGSDAANEEMGRLYDAIVEASGDEAARQAYDAWCKCAENSRTQKGKEAAAKWYKEVYQQIPENTWDTMDEYGYDEYFLRGLSSAYRDTRKGNERHFDWMGESSDKAVFAYAFLKGLEAAAANAEQKVQARSKEAKTAEDRKTVLKLTLLNLCDMLTDGQIEAVIEHAEDLL